VVEPGLDSVLTVTFAVREGDDAPRADEVGQWLVRRWPLGGGPSELVGAAAGTISPAALLDPSRGLLIVGYDDELHLHRLDTLGGEPPRVVGRHSAGFWWLGLDLDPTGERLAVCDLAGTLRVWPLDGDGTRPERELETPGWPFGTAFSQDGSWLAQATDGGVSSLWDLRGPASAEPLQLGASGTRFGVRDATFTPDGRWLATASSAGQLGGPALWPLSSPYPRVLRATEGTMFRALWFHPDGSRMFPNVVREDGSEMLLSWPLTGGAGVEPAVLFRDTEIAGHQVDPHGRFLVASSTGGVRMIPLDGGAPIELEGVLRTARLRLDPTGRYLASRLHIDSQILAVRDLETGALLEVEAPGDGDVQRWDFDYAGRLLVVRGGVISRWDRQTRATEVLASDDIGWAVPIGDGRRVYVESAGSPTLSILDLEDGSRTVLPEAHQLPFDTYWDHPAVSIWVTGFGDGEVRVGPLFSEQPHLLLGHERGNTAVYVSPDCKWVASRGSEGTVRVWPMPDFSKPPLHTLPHDELMAKLESFTNLRAVPDEDSHTGYSIEADFSAYHGWETMPEW
jgi:WD40 repeat protein